MVLYQQIEIPSLFVHYKDNFLEDGYEGSIEATNKSSWINGDISISVLKHIQKHPLNTKDNITVEAINYSKDTGIIYLSFLPHTSQFLQSLFVGIFGPFKSKLKIAFNNWHIMNS